MISVILGNFVVLTFPSFYVISDWEMVKARFYTHPDLGPLRFNPESKNGVRWASVSAFGLIEVDIDEWLPCRARCSGSARYKQPRVGVLTRKKGLVFIRNCDSALR